ncbi:hypothetical protein RhiirA1_214626 [Rhizophagus irregularis]|uniref:Uncharacterized protein n=1 Tax=Rhizophagus irregularis TaxID=588596 RepID=A0A2N0RN84_9GLOM|nr:hypothetical protein RhiirA1_214626 [Rhizophagus irregularis]GET59796.1 hypothetical protein RIR_e11987_A0A2N0RN84_9GLOM [Rhizophagus irregularis DAOM 181602=DAOM 197198]
MWRSTGAVILFNYNHNKKNLIHITKRRIFSIIISANFISPNLFRLISANYYPVKNFSP